MDSGQFVKKFWTEIQAVMSTLSGRGGIKNWRVSANISFHLEKKTSALWARQYRHRCRPIM